MNREVFFSLNDCSFGFGKKNLFKDLSLTIHQDDKIALTGKNGVGKSTLLKIIYKLRQIDSGELWISPELTIGYLNQNQKRSETFKVFDFLNQNIGDELSNNKYKILNICENMKLDYSQKVCNLSEGNKRRLNLASLIINEPRLLLLDEPTNHLDIESIKWLEHFLNKEFKGAFLVISHNRNFLNNVTNKVFWMDRGKIRVSPKGFYSFDEWSKGLIEHEKREIHNKERFLENEVEWLSKGVTARRKRNIRRKKNIFNFKLSLKEERSEFLKSVSRTRIIFDEKDFDSPNLLVNFYNVKKKFKNNKKEITVLEDFNFKLMKGQKIGLIGKNGCGKSTFINMITNTKLIDQGTIKVRKNIELSVFDQTGSQFNDKKSIKENLIPGGGDYINVGQKRMHICGYLKNYLFDPKTLDRNVGLLSGGERNRLLLAKILASPKEILLLDEPTNDLDIETIDLLIDFLQKFPGACIIASHDIDFLEKVVDNFFLMDGTGYIKNTTKFPNEYFLKKATKDNKISSEFVEKKNLLKTSEKLDNQKKISRILKKIEKKEDTIFSLSKKLEESDYKKENEKFNEILNQIEANQSELKDLENEWFELEEKSLND